MPDARLIDLRHLGRERVIGTWQVGDLLVDPGPESCLPTLLEALGDQRPRALLLTHIHFDHAGVAGALVQRWPDLAVHVHERGAPHLADPERLVRSARRLYGEDFDRLWGRVVPVPTGNLRVITGDEDEVEGLQVAYTPGHASHHVAYFDPDLGRAYTGDVGGVRIAPAGFAVAPTPPPDIDRELWLDSLAALEAWRPQTLGITHFGLVEDVAIQLAGVRDKLDRWGELARAGDRDAFVDAVHAEVAAATDPETAAAYEQAAPADQLFQGLARYWSTRERG